MTTENGKNNFKILEDYLNKNKDDFKNLFNFYINFDIL